MSLWTDLIEPAELTGFVRAAFEETERAKGLLARFLPNTFVPDVLVKFAKGEAGLVEEASYRAFDAEPEVIAPGRLGRVIIELPAIGSLKPVGEYLQLRARGASDEVLRDVVLKEALRSVQGVSDRTERMRGTVLATGKATIDQENFTTEDDFGRDPSMTVTAATLWNASGAKILDDMIGWADAYADLNGERPGALVVSSRIARAIRAATEFQVKLIDGASRAASMDQVNAILDAEGLPSLVVYDRRTQRGGKRLRVLPEDTLLLLPAPSWASAVRTPARAVRKASISSGVPMLTRRYPSGPTTRMRMPRSSRERQTASRSSKGPNRTKLASESWAVRPLSRSQATRASRSARREATWLMSRYE